MWLSRPSDRDVLGFIYTGSKSGKNLGSIQNVWQQSSNRHTFSLSLRKNVLYLQGVGEELVKLGHLGGDGEVDGSVSDLDNETTEDIRVDLSPRVSIYVQSTGITNEGSPC